MNITPGEVIGWTEAHDVQIAISGITDSIGVYQTIVNERVDLVRTAIGVALIERFEDATATAILGKESLGSMGVFFEVSDSKPSTELVVDRQITRNEFGWIATEVFKRATPLGEKLWNTLRRETGGSIFFVIEPKTLGEDYSYELSLKGLREFIESGALSMVNGVGASQMRLARAVVEYFSVP